MRKRGASAGPVSLDFRLVFERLSTPHLLLNARFDIVEINRAYLDALRCRAQDAVGNSIFSVCPIEGEARHQLQDSLLRARDYDVVDVMTLSPSTGYRLSLTTNGFEHRYWSCVHTPIRDGDGAVFVLQQVQDITELQQLREVVFGNRLTIEPMLLGGDVLLRAHAAAAVNETLLAEHSHLRQLFMQAPGMMCVLSGPDHVFELVNRACLEIVGERDILGKPIGEALPEIRGQGHIELLDKVRSSGQAFVGQGMRLALLRKPEEALAERYFDLVYQPITASDGTVSAIFVAGVDITDRILAQEQQRLLMDELNHRVKNTLATVEAIAAQTLRSGTPLERFAETFQARLRALSRTHNVLTKGQWQGAELRDILKEELRPYGETRIELSGPPVHLPPRSVLSLGLVFHELAVNAAKYGALSTAQGRLTVTWRKETIIEEAAFLEIEWQELGGPPAIAPQRRGFGSRLIQRSITGELNGQLAMDYRAEGLVCRFTISLGDHSA